MAEFSLPNQEPGMEQPEMNRAARLAQNREAAAQRAEAKLSTVPDREAALQQVEQQIGRAKEVLSSGAELGKQGFGWLKNKIQAAREKGPGIAKNIAAEGWVAMNKAEKFVSSRPDKIKASYYSALEKMNDWDNRAEQWLGNKMDSIVGSVKAAPMERAARWHEKRVGTFDSMADNVRKFAQVGPELRQKAAAKMREAAEQMYNTMMSKADAIEQGRSGVEDRLVAVQENFSGRAAEAADLVLQNERAAQVARENEKGAGNIRGRIRRFVRGG